MFDPLESGFALSPADQIPSSPKFKVKIVSAGAGVGDALGDGVRLGVDVGTGGQLFIVKPFKLSRPPPTDLIVKDEIAVDEVA